MSDRDWNALKQHSDYAEVLQRVIDGDNPTVVAEWVQQQGWCQDVQLASVIRSLNRMRTDMLPLTPSTILQKEEAVGGALLDGEAKGINALAEFEAVLELQKDRVRRADKLERSLGVLLPHVGREITSMASILREYIQLLQSLGFVPKVPERMLIGMVNAQDTSRGDRLRGVMGGMTEHQRERLVAVLLDDGSGPPLLEGDERD